MDCPEGSGHLSEIPWEWVLKPGRAVCYDLLAQGAPELGRLLHEKGWGPYGMVPFGFSGPVFPAAPRRRGVYAAGGRGVLELGSPLPDVVMGWSSALAGREVIDWGGVAVRVLACACALEPLAEMWVHELKGSGDLDPLERVAHRFVSGVDDESIGYAAESPRAPTATPRLRPGHGA